MRSEREFIPLNLKGDQLQEAERLVRHMEGELRNGEPGSQMITVGLFCRLLVFLCRCYARSPGSHYKELQDFDRVLLYMNSHYQEPITRAELAALVAKSESRFYRAFRRLIG